MSIIPLRTSFFKAGDEVFDEEKIANPSKISKAPNVLPERFLGNVDFKSVIYSARLTNIGYLKNLLATNNNSQIQAVIKVISTANQVRGVKNAVNYIARFAGLKAGNKASKDTKLYDQDNREIKNKEEATEIVKEWQKDFKKGQNIMSHMIFSIGGEEEKNKIKAFLATKKFLEDNFKAKGFDYFLTPHYDTKNHHFHVIVKKKSKFGKNFYLDKHDLFVMRDLYAKTLTAFGVKRASAARMDKKEALEKIAKKIAILKEQNSHYQAKLAKGGAENFNAYLYKAKIAGKLESVIKEIGYNKNSKKMDILDKSKLNNHLKALKNFKKEIIKSTTKEEVKKAISLTINYFNKENQTIAKKIDDFANQNQDIKFAYLKSKQQADYLRLMIKKQLEEIGAAKAQLELDLKNNKFNSGEREVVREAFVYFDEMIKNGRKMMKGVGIGMG